MPPDKKAAAAKAAAKAAAEAAAKAKAEGAGTGAAPAAPPAAVDTRCMEREAIRLIAFLAHGSVACVERVRELGGLFTVLQVIALIALLISS